MYINEYDFGKKNVHSVKKVAEYFNNVGANCPSTADSMDVSGSFMMSLVRMGAAQVVGKKECFVCVDERQQLYRRYEANLYVLTITPSDFWNRYVRGVEQNCNVKKKEAENLVSAARYKLSEVQHLLNEIDKIRI